MGQPRVLLRVYCCCYDPGVMIAGAIMDSIVEFCFVNFFHYWYAPLLGNAPLL